MSFISTLNSLEKKFSWSLFGFVLAAFFGSLTIYTEFFKVDTPYLTTEILSETNVLSFNEEVKDLKVFWGDIDIKNLEKTISVLSIRVKNNGGSSLLKEHYDSEYPVAILVDKAEILEVELISSSSDYLKERAVLSFRDSKVFLPEVILDQDNSYIFKMLLLHNNRIQPKFSIIGKIANISELKITHLIEEKKVGFWSEVFSGNIWVHVVRVPAYFFAFFFSLIFTILPLVATSEFFSKRKRKRILRKYKEMSSIKESTFQEYFYKLFVNSGLSNIENISEFISDKNNIKFYPEKSKKHLNDEYRKGYYIRKRSQRDNPSDDLDARSNPYKEYHLYSLLDESEIIKTEDGVANVKSGSSEFLSDFIKFVQIREK